MMRRRELITLLGGGAAWPLAARAQQSAMPVIGFLNPESADGAGERLRGFRQGLSEIGYVESRNVAIEYRWAEGQYDRLPALAADLVRRQVTVIYAAAVRAALEAKAATKKIPIVFSTAGDQVTFGLVTSLSRTDSNLTGVTNLNVVVGPKLLEMLHELLPTATIVGLLVNPANPVSETQLRDAQTAARTLGLQVHVLYASTELGFNAAFATLPQIGGGALMIGADVFFNTQSERLAALALRQAVPTISSTREFAVAGGLMSYSGSNSEMYRLAGVYTGRILRGEKPADLPVQQVTKVELVINLKTAKALGITVPLALLARADEVIE
jgi:putative ABC transport system substrate-binding protein